MMTVVCRFCRTWLGGDFYYDAILDFGRKVLSKIPWCNYCKHKELNSYESYSYLWVDYGGEG